jgi:hypothetical protein
MGFPEALKRNIDWLTEAVNGRKEPQEAPGSQ